MKLIHCADIHLGSKMDARLPKEKAEQRRRELRTVFGKMIGFAAENGVKAILLCGDVFDSDRPLKKDKEFFYGAVRSNPEIDFLYLRGNHDGEQSYTEDDLPNLITFREDWKTVQYGNVDIYGTEISENNCLSLYSSLSVDRTRKNIVMLHGALGDTAGSCAIKATALRGLGIDYLALGHYHSYDRKKIDERCTACYSGCLAGRGFDECGPKGFVLLDTDAPDGSGISAGFIPFAPSEIKEIVFDVSGCRSSYDVFRKAEEVCREAGLRKEDMLRLILRGEIGSEEGNETLREEAEKYLSDSDLCFFVSVKDETVRKIDPEALGSESSVSLRGEFIRAVFDSGLDENDRAKVIALGLRALNEGGAD